MHSFTNESSNLRSFSVVELAHHSGFATAGQPLRSAHTPSGRFFDNETRGHGITLQSAS